MGSGRAAVGMDAAETERFLAAHHKVQVATISADGSPHLTALFYVLEQGRLAFWTYARSQKVVNLRRDPRVTCLVEDGNDYVELRGVSIRGRARLVEDYEQVRDLGARVVRRMAAGAAGEGEPAELGELGDAVVEQQAHKRVGVVVEPLRVVSWDHAKLAGVPGRG